MGVYRKLTRLCTRSPTCAFISLAGLIVMYFMILPGLFNSDRKLNARPTACLKSVAPSKEERTAERTESCRDSLCGRHVTPELQATFKAGRWRSMLVAPSYHKHYSVNCSGIIHNNQSVISNAYELIREEQRNNENLLPCDTSVSNWTRDCKIYRRTRRYPSDALSIEEADYPIAYIITVHKEAAQVERLLRAIYQPQNTYCIHVDLKSSPNFQNAIGNLAGCFDNVFIASKLEDVVYGGFTRVQADLNCMSDLLRYHWKYVINLCGQDFPLKTNLEIVKQMKAYRGLNDIPGVYPEQTDWFVGRTKFKHVIRNGKDIRTNIEKPAPPHNSKMFFGNAYYAASKPYVEYLFSSRIAEDLLHYLKDAFSPDEHYWVTVNRYPGVPGGYPNSTWNSNVRFIRWTNSDYYAPCIGKYVRAVCVIGAGYLPYLSNVPNLFVNKVYYAYDPITLQCLEEFLDYRTVFPDAISEYIQNYPLTNLFL